MKQRVCRVCNSVMKKETTEEGIKFLCRQCDAYTDFDEMEMEPYCPTCGEKIAEVFSCCCLTFFCSKCDEQKAGTRIVWKK